MPTLICGSFAYDTIMVFNDRFKNHILPDQVHILNVSFVVPEMTREFGGCAGNIAYNLKLLGGDPLPMGAVGTDFGDYYARLGRFGINHTHVRTMEDAFTAQCFITTDMDDNQINAFHPGAMNLAHLIHVNEAEGVELGIISPDGPQGMLAHGEQFAAAGIPFLFDPGQQLPRFDAAELIRMIEQSTWIALNDYESRLLHDRTGYGVEELLEHVEAVIITLGGRGSIIHTRDGQHEIPAVVVATEIDPTGCGDAYRAGLLYGIANRLDWPTTGRIASLMGAIKIEHRGTQNHSFEPEEFDTRYREAFGHNFR